MPPRRSPTPQEAHDATARLLLALEAGTDIIDALDDISPLHPTNDTFPGEVFLQLAARAMAEGEVSPATPISETGLIDAHLPECEFRGRDNHKIRYALLAAAAIHGASRSICSTRWCTGPPTTSGATPDWPPSLGSAPWPHRAAWPSTSCADASGHKTPGRAADSPGPCSVAVPAASRHCSQRGPANRVIGR